MTPDQIKDALRAPFDEKHILWRAGSVSERNKKVQLLAYIDARMVADRLDQVFGIGCWTNEYRVVQGGMICRIGCLIDGHWIYREDGAATTDIEAFKGGLSDAFKRAAVKWGIGAYLYDLDSPWVSVVDDRPAAPNRVALRKNSHGKGLDGWAVPPALPAWARPAGAAAPPPRATTAPTNEAEDPEWAGDRARFLAALKSIQLAPAAAQQELDTYQPGRTIAQVGRSGRLELLQRLGWKPGGRDPGEEG